MRHSGRNGSKCHGEGVWGMLCEAWLGAQGLGKAKAEGKATGQFYFSLISFCDSLLCLPGPFQPHASLFSSQHLLTCRGRSLRSGSIPKSAVQVMKRRVAGGGNGRRSRPPRGRRGVLLQQLARSCLLSAWRVSHSCMLLFSSVWWWWWRACVGRGVV